MGSSWRIGAKIHEQMMWFIDVAILSEKCVHEKERNSAKTNVRKPYDSCSRIGDNRGLGRFAEKVGKLKKGTTWEKRLKKHERNVSIQLCNSH